MTDPASPLVPISWGELLDKMTILDIKLDHIDNPEARTNLLREYQILTEISLPVTRDREVANLVERLKHINEQLWDIEDAIRVEEAQATFGSTFIALARAVYTKNDQRARLKRDINMLLASELIEEKSYAAAGSASINPPALA
ncbi:DUF6165 family protein [Flavisphingomonas formosensis]|uniref:DUF6165 family protein n=1 Tax=Flavisphingomonas formosensis TaxID=861534 RepID=UPI0012F9656B|nr:DUF6165 family protein [Sphingomonas formosensis]